MFDDHMPQGSTPSNLPIGEPEDMFAATDPAPAATPPPQTPVADAAVSEVQPEETPTPPEIQESRTADSPGEAPLPSAMSAGKLQPIGANPIMPEMTAPSTSPTAEAPLAVPPSSPTADPAMSTMPPEMRGGAGLPMTDDTMRGPSVFRTIIMISIVLAIALLIGGGLWYVFTALLTSDRDTPTPSAPSVVELPTVDPSLPPPLIEDPIAEPEDVVELESTMVDTTSTPLPEVTTSTDTLEELGEEAAVDTRESQILFGDTIDTDEDQLEDNKELEFGTDPRNWDTDGDRLSDGIEVLNWGTDPLDPDTDGDGYNDGDEVEAGYSPVAGGGARLFESANTAS